MCNYIYTMYISILYVWAPFPYVINAPWDWILPSSYSSNWQARLNSPDSWSNKNNI